MKRASRSPTILYVSRPGVATVGGGGKHRAYQIAHDLEQLVGQERLKVLNVPDWLPAPSKAGRWWQRQVKRFHLDQLQARVSFAHFYKMLAPTAYRQNHFAARALVQEYARLLQTLPRPLITILTDTRLAELAKRNQIAQIPTVWCPHNLEALDQPQRPANRWLAHAIASDFANEWRLLAQGADRLLTSKVETALLNGTGLSAHHYPYRPVGEIEQRLGQIRQQRLTTPPQPGLFLLLGSAIHTTTGQAMRWFVQQAQQHGLPSGIQVSAIGMQSHTLLPAGERLPGLELKGWLDQPSLDRLLVQAQGVLTPQHAGFGALTRLPEMACAGIPVITSRHPTDALNLPPGVWVAHDEWESWCEQMRWLQQTSPQHAPHAYERWQAEQPRPLEKRLPHWLETVKGKA